MILITNGHPNLDLGNLPSVTEVWCSLSGTNIIIHLSCKEGDEKHVFGNLPKWVHDEMKVTKSSQHVFLEGKPKE